MPQPVQPHYVLNYFTRHGELCPLSKKNIDISTLLKFVEFDSTRRSLFTPGSSPDEIPPTRRPLKNISHMLSSISFRCCVPVISPCRVQNPASCRHAPRTRPCHAETLCAMLLPRRIGCCSPGAVFVWHLNSSKVMVVVVVVRGQPGQVSSGAGGALC